MTTEPQEPRQEAAFFSTIRSWGVVRGSNGVMGGVVEGAAAKVGMDRVPARIIVVVASFVLFGPIALAYAAGWALLPDQEGNIIIQNFGRGRPNVGALIMIAILGLAGLDNVDQPFTWGWASHAGWGTWSFIAFLVFAGIVGLVIWMVVPKRDRSGPYAVVPPRPNRGDFAQPPVAPSPTIKPTESSQPRASAAAVPPATATRPAPASATTAPPVAPRPPRIRVPGPGRTIYLVTFAATLLTAAATWWLARDGRLDVSPAAAFFAALVVIVGAAIVAAGAAGRRIGFLAFLGTVLIIGWIIGLSVPGATGWLDGHVNLSINGVSIDAQTLPQAEVARQAFACGDYDASVADAAANKATTEGNVLVAPASGGVEVTQANTIITVGDDARVTVYLTETAPLSGDVSWESANVTCSLDSTRDRLVLGSGPQDVYVSVNTADAHIVIKEN